MGLAQSLYTGLSGLTVHSEMLTVAGNNISNVNTTAFKSSRMTFESAVLQNLKPGSAPGQTTGGTNPSQIGLGVRIAGTQRNMNNGNIQPTGVNTDIAIEGSGMFVLSSGGSSFYTRDGSFTMDRDYNLVRNGMKLQGFGVDENFDIIDGILTDVNVPLGVMTLAEATNTVNFAGNLNAGGEVATHGSISTSAPLYSDALATTPALATDALSGLFNADGTALFAIGDVITVSGVSKGGANLPEHTFEVGPANTTDSDSFGTTLQDFMDFMDAMLGLDSAADPSAGVTLSGAGEMVFTSNSGTHNGIELENADIIVNADTTPTLPLTFTQTQDANGESVRTTFVAYDSLGKPMSVDLTMVMESADNSGTTWRFYVQSTDDTDLDRVLGNGTVSFDNNGRMTTSTNNSFVIDRANTGASTPQQISLEFRDPTNTVSALADVTSQLVAKSQDGSPIGTLQDFSVGDDGTIMGIFSNSLIRNLGRVALANFSNPAGLNDLGGNLFDVSSNSGIAQILTPTTGGSGRLIGGALELSNVELSQEFINLITASTGFSASSRVLTTSERLIQELLSTIR